MDLLLDTHAVIWSLYEPERMPRALRERLVDTSSTLFFSEASLWEFLDKAAKGRLHLADTSPTKILAKISALGLIFVPVTKEDIVAAVLLPKVHGDPFDRMMVAQAMRRNLTLVTRDRLLSSYNVGVLWQ